jgi:signal transduction histidine kinase
MNAPHILLVDDDETLLQALPHMMALRIHGVQVDTSDTALGAIERIQEHDYDAIVSDIKMPGMDGLELLTKIQEMRPDIPTLLITGHADQGLIIQALRNGAYDFIQKPIDRVYFVAALHRAIQARQLRRQVQEQQEALQLNHERMEQLVAQRTRELLATNEVLDVLVRDLFDCTLIRSNEYVLHPTPCNLVELCQQILDAFIAGAGLTLTFECNQETITVNADRERISQVLIHLLSNARKFSPPESPIMVALQQAGDEAIISVCDMGIGIAEEILPHIFEQFYRGPEAEVQPDKHSSVGLGLYLCQHIVELHNGRIEVTSSQGKGSLFSVILPIYTSPTTEEEEDTPSGHEHEPTPFPPPQWLVS